MSKTYHVKRDAGANGRDVEATSREIALRKVLGKVPLYPIEETAFSTQFEWRFGMNQCFKDTYTVYETNSPG